MSRPIVARSAPLNPAILRLDPRRSVGLVARELLRPNREKLSAAERLPGLVLVPRLSRVILVPPIGPILRRYRSTSLSRSEFPDELPLSTERRRLLGVVPLGGVSRRPVLGVVRDTLLLPEVDSREVVTRLGVELVRGTVTRGLRVVVRSEVRDLEVVRGTVTEERLRTGERTDGTLRGAVRRMLLLRLGE